MIMKFKKAVWIFGPILFVDLILLGIGSERLATWLGVSSPYFQTWTVFVKTIVFVVCVGMILISDKQKDKEFFAPSGPPLRISNVRIGEDENILSLTQWINQAKNTEDLLEILDGVPSDEFTEDEEVAFKEQAEYLRLTPTDWAEIYLVIEEDDSQLSAFAKEKMK